MNRNLRLRPASLVATAVALVLAQNAIAQEEEPTTLGEITVTARKRAESLQDVPFAISARTGEQLDAVGATNIEDVSRNVAGLSVQNLGPGQSQVGLRGISAGKTDRDLPGVKEQVGVYMDESVISLSLFTPDLDLYDLNRVEVLRGPQGTLFGSGSLAGTVRYISNQPDLSDGYGDFEVGISTISDGGDGGYVRSHAERAARRPRGAARRRLLQRDAGLHRRPRPRRHARRGRQRRRAAGRPRGAALGADRQHRGHAARHLPGHRLQRLQPRGRLQHPRATRSRRPSRA